MRAKVFQALAGNRAIILESERRIDYGREAFVFLDTPTPSMWYPSGKIYDTFDR